METQTRMIAVDAGTVELKSRVVYETPAQYRKRMKERKVFSQGKAINKLTALFKSRKERSYYNDNH